MTEWRESKSPSPTLSLSPSPHHSVLKTIITKFEEPMETHTHTKQCDFCQAEEGKPRLIGGFIVELKTVEIFGTDKIACQSCSRKHRAILQSGKKAQRLGKIDQQLRKFISFVAHFFILIIVFSAPVLAQPPGLPGSPDQAPIDGGLGLLAAAGGSYALKKLRDRKNAAEDQD